MSSIRTISLSVRFAAGVIAIATLFLPQTAMGTEGEEEDLAYVAVDRSAELFKPLSAMEMPEELQNWSTLEPPGARGPSRALAENPLQPVYFNPLTREEFMPDSLPLIDSAGETVIEGFLGLAPTEELGESVIGTDDRSLITSVTTYPWRTVVKLYIEAADGSNWNCSGMIVDSFHVLTAGHCAYLHDHGGWAAAIRVVPGMDQSYWPYNYAWSNLIRSYTGWTTDENHEHDWALLRLDRNVGNFTGWMGRTTAASSHSMYTGGMNVAGYPCDLDGCQRMYFDSDSGRTANDNNHWYYADTAGGMSGGPVWRYDSGTGNRYIMTVHAYGNDGSGSNHGTRLNQDKYDRVNTWLGEDTPPTDRADLVDDGNLYSGFSPSTVTRNVTSFTVHNDTRNVGTAASGGFYIHFYASINDFISTGDYHIASKYVSSIAALTYADVSYTGTFPLAIPAGTYYVGWILDATGAVTEFDETNNTAYTTPTITVIDPCSLDYYEANNTSGTAGTLYPNMGTQSHSICLEGDDDWSTFTVSEESSLVISTSGASGDTEMWLYNSGLTEIAYDDDSGPGWFSLIETAIPAGTYYVLVREYGDNYYIPSYTLGASTTPAEIFSDGFESNNTNGWSYSAP